MAEKKYYWIKLSNKLLTSRTVDFLMSQKDGANYVVLYQMLCLLTINSNGELCDTIGEVIIPFDENKIQRETKYFTIDTVRVALSLFKKLGLIYLQENGIFKIVDYERLIGSECSSAERVRKHRLLKSESALHCNKNVTQENKDKILDNRDNRDNSNNNIKEKEEKNINEQLLPSSSNSSNVKNNNLSFSEMIDNYTNDNDLKESLNAFIDMRKKIKKPLTNYAFKLILNKLNKLAIENKTKILILNQSIRNSWQDVYEIHDRNDVLKNKNNDETVDNFENNNDKKDEYDMEELLKIIGD